MSIALERGGGIGGSSGFIRGIACCPVFESTESAGGDVRRKDPPPAAAVEREESSSCSSSSIGRNSDESSGTGNSEGEGEGDGEVQSKYKGPLETMDALEDSLPIRRGISKFYRGKSKSFTSLADTLSSSPSAKDLAKPENAYTRKRKNLLAFGIMYEKPFDNDTSSNKGGLSKRLANSSRSTSMPTITGSSSGSTSNCSEEEREPARLLPPRYPQGKPTALAATAVASLCSTPAEKHSLPIRSFSLADLQGVVSSSSSLGPRDNYKRNK